MTRIVELTLSSPVEAWRRLGIPLEPSDSGAVVTVGSVVLRVGPTGDGDCRGITGWVLSDEASDEAEVAGRIAVLDEADGPGEIDGLPTRLAPPDDAAVSGATSAVRSPYSRIDHVVVTTPSLERTCGAIEAATGEPLKRVRDAGPGIRQGFHRFGEVIVEVVERADLPADALAEFWGLVLVVDGDLLDLCEALGPEVIGLPKPAVQKGRFIATVRGELGLGLPVALMTA